MKHLGIESQFAPINDIIANGRKISGNAQTRKFNSVLQHGTVLMGVDIAKMFSLLKVPDEKMKGKMMKAVEDRVTSLKKETGKEISFDGLAEALQKGFSENFNARLVEEKLSPKELLLGKKIAKERFFSHEWNFMR